MISWILFAIFCTWVLINRFSEGGKIEDEPLGMPRGTVRALMTILLVAFPFGYIISGEEIPGLIINIIFVVVAFYFEARRSGHEKLKEIVDEIKTTDILVEDVRKPKKPLYLPKYSVRFLLVVMLVITQIMIFLQPSVTFQITNTLADLLLIIILFIIGASFRSILKAREKKTFKEKIANMDASLSDVQVIEKLMLEEASWWKRTGKNILSLIMLIVVIIALLCYTFNWDYILFSSPSYTLTFVGFFLLLVNAYYGFRD
ncbi:MAG: hypothetical protein KAV01_07570 [Candidatus Lokiarchaeota archaeon]|nr:hypothetical protein [Candidatus Lokiarchaeota archaeon]MCK4480370.1 hypothetical protein [Candidatus Lokiarchaeota archaeon]